APSLLPVSQGPRLIVYHQTHHLSNGDPVSLLPLITNNTGITHVIVAALHLNDGPGNITLNNDPPSHNKFDQLWGEVRWLQGAGVRVLLMLGGAAQGTYERLCGDNASFEAYYQPLLSILRTYNFNGIDLDIEEPVTHLPIRRLILRLHQDMGDSFLITLAPVATALTPDPKIPIIMPVFGLLPSLRHLSGDKFSYFVLESDPELKRIISWYNVQFYCGWGDASRTTHYDTIIRAGWDPSRVVMGVVTNAENGAGHVPPERLSEVITTLRQTYPDFGGVMGWEYFNAGLESKEGNGPWEWVGKIGKAARMVSPAASVPIGPKPNMWKEEDVQWLIEMGADRGKAEGALEAADGNVEVAAGLLFE
ncbi:glycoside hydrolase, partial [Rhizodiscina lignyota]